MASNCHGPILPRCYALPANRMTRLSHISRSLLALAGAPILVFAQGADTTHRGTRPVARAAKVATAIVLDGRLDELDWMAATPATDFRQFRPNEGQSSTQRTEVRILYDEEALYVGARMNDSLGARFLDAVTARRGGGYPVRHERVHDA